MSKRNSGRKRQPSPRVVATKGSWKMYLLMSMCVSIMVAGFFFAARQHFSSIDYGIRNSRLRKQLDDLESEKRRLLLAREISVSPLEIRKAAKKLGIGEAPADNVQLASVAKPEKSAGQAVLTADKTLARATQDFIVVKTGMSTEANRNLRSDKPKKEVPPERPRQIMAAALSAP